MSIDATPTQTVAVNLTAAGTSNTVTIASILAGGTCVLFWGGDSSTQSITPSMPNTTWVKAIEDASAGSAFQVWIGSVAGGASGTTLTITSAISMATKNVKGTFWEWRNVYPVAVNPLSTTGTSATPTPPSQTALVGRNALTLNFMRHNVGATLSSGPTGGFTDPSVSGSALSRASYLVEAVAAGAHQGVWTMSASGAWVAGSLVLYDVSVAATAITVQPPTSVASGGALTGYQAKATTNGTTPDVTYQGPAVVSIASGWGTVGNDTVTCVNGVADLSSVTVTSDGAVTFLVAMTGYITATTNSVTVLGAAANANISLVAIRGNSAWPAVYDRRLNIAVSAGKVATLDDAIGSYGGRTPGPQLAEATSGNRPALTGTQGSGSEVITFTAASSQRLASAQDTRFTFDGSGACYVWVIAKLSSAGYVAALASDPASATTYPYGGLQGAASNWKADFAPTGSANRSQPDTGVAFNDNKIRLLCIGKGIRVGGGNSGGDETWRFFFMGRQQQCFARDSVATTVAGGLKFVLGRLGATYADMVLYWAGVGLFDPTRADWLAAQSFAVAQHGAEAA